MATATSWRFTMMLLSACASSGEDDGLSPPPPVAVNPGPVPDAGLEEAGQPADASWLSGGADIPEYSLGRLLVSRIDAAELDLLDLDSGKVAARIPFAPQSAVHSGTSGRYGYVGASDHGWLRILDPGHWLLSHIDHFHVVRGTPKLFEEQVALGALTSFSAHDGWIATYDGAQGRSTVFQERSLTAGAFAPLTASVGVPANKGIAIVSHARWFVSETTPSGSAKLAERSAIDPAEGSTRVDACSDPTASGAHGEVVFVGCAEGLLRLRHDAAQQRFVPSMTPLAVGERVTHIATAPGFAGAVVQVDPHTLLIVNEQAGEPRRAAFPSAVLQLAVRRNGATALVLTQDGVLHELALDAAMVTRTLQVLERQPPAARERPRLVLSHAYAYLTDPLKPRIVVVRLAAFQREGDLTLDGPAFDLAIVGLPATYTDYRE